MKQKDSTGTCPLCAGSDIFLFHHDKKREYLRCGNCHLIHVPEQYFISPADEKRRYDVHQNSPENQGYRNFLMKLVNPLVKRIKPGCNGLDFGSGPEPILASLLSEAGFRMSLYDVFYNIDESVWQQDYDFIAACEVIEHLHHPWLEMERLFQHIKPGGLLAIMTGLVPDTAEFTSWHYITDATHVTFFGKETFTWLANRWNASLSFPDDNVILLNKRPPAKLAVFSNEKRL